MHDKGNPMFLANESSEVAIQVSYPKVNSKRLY